MSGKIAPPLVFSLGGGGGGGALPAASWITFSGILEVGKPWVCQLCRCFRVMDPIAGRLVATGFVGGQGLQQPDLNRLCHASS